MTLLKRQKYSDEGRMRDCQQLGVEGEYYYKGTTQEFFFGGGDKNYFDCSRGYINLYMC